MSDLSELGTHYVHAPRPRPLGEPERIAGYPEQPAQAQKRPHAERLLARLDKGRVQRQDMRLDASGPQFRHKRPIRSQHDDRDVARLVQRGRQVQQRHFRRSSSPCGQKKHRLRRGWL